MDKFNVINILDLIDNVGEPEVISSISSFKCSKNKEIEKFIHSDAINFAKQKISVTHLVFDENANIVGYFTLTHKSIKVSAEFLSNTAKKKIERFTNLDKDTNSYDVSAFLIAQFGKNATYENDITGDEMMKFAISILRKVQRQIGGGVMFLECEDNIKLLNFYQNENNRFMAYGDRYSEKDNITYKLLLRMF